MAIACYNSYQLLITVIIMSSIMFAMPQRFEWKTRAPTEAKRFRLLSRTAFTLPDEAYIQRCSELLMQGDPVADDLACWFERTGWQVAHQQLNQAIEQGIASIRNPAPELVAMMAQVERTPLWLDSTLLDVGAKALRRVGPLGSLALRDVALMGGYGNAAINKPLMFTGALQGGAARRATETRAFWVDVTRENGLARNAPGFRSALHVRMMHGVLRHRIHKHPDWSDAAWGVPINQGDMLATNLAFSVVFMTVLASLGVRFSRQERNGIMHLWRYVGYLMGIDETILVTSEAEGLRYLYAVLMSQPAADEDTKALATALMNEPYEQFGQQGWQAWLAEAHVRAHNGVSRLFLGAKSYQRLGLPVDRCWSWFPLTLIPPILAAEATRFVMPKGTDVFARLGGEAQQRLLQKRLKKKPAQYKPVEAVAHPKASKAKVG